MNYKIYLPAVNCTLRGLNADFFVIILRGGKILRPCTIRHSPYTRRLCINRRKHSWVILGGPAVPTDPGRGERGTPPWHIIGHTPAVVVPITRTERFLFWECRFHGCPERCRIRDIFDDSEESVESCPEKRWPPLFKKRYVRL